MELGQPHSRGLEGLISGKGERLNKSIDCANQAADSLFMSENWTDHELDMCVRAYMWMLDAQNRGYTSVIKAKVDRALRAGPLDARGKLDYRFANIASRVEAKRLEILVGYKPQAHVGANISGLIDGFIERYQNGERHQRRLDCLVKEIPSGDFSLAAEMLASGVVYDFPGSTTYDVAFNGSRIPPKKLTSYASLLYYGAPLFSDNFVGAKVGIAFKKIRESGLVIVDKDEEPDDNIDSPEFRSKVKQARKELRKKATGNLNPKKKTSVSTGYDRDPYVVADAEDRAGGICELCLKPAPFMRSDGTPYLEVHHIIFLSERGPDVLENVAALCPNCHRECHSGASASELRSELLKKLSDF